MPARPGQHARPQRLERVPGRHRSAAARVGLGGALLGVALSAVTVGTAGPAAALGLPVPSTLASPAPSPAPGPAAGPVAGPVAALPPTCVTALACDTAAAPVFELERRIDDHLRYGQVLEIDYRTPERVLGEVVSGGAWGDSALWTGVYLAGQAMRYQVARTRLAAGDDPALWTAQRDEALSRVRTMAQKFHLLARIGREWRTELAPNTSYDPTSPAGGPPSFGGGVVQGEEGLLMRGCAPAPEDTPDGIGIAPNANKRVFGPFRWEDGLDYYCETAPSRDSYAGTLYGLLHAYDLVGPDDPQLRALIRSDVLVLAQRLVKYGWSFPRPHGNVSVPDLPVDVPVTGFNGHDFDNFASPAFMQQVPSARLNVAQSARHVAQEGTPEQKAFWDAVYAEELATQLPALGLSMEVDAAEPNNGYFKFNLNHLTLSNMIRLEADPLVRQEMKRALDAMDNTTGDDGNAHFQSIVHGRTGEPARAAAAVQHLSEWLDYRAATHAAPVNNSRFCEQSGGPLECVANGQLEYGDVVVHDPATYTGGNPRLRARDPLPVARRTPTDFLWQRPPTQLDGAEGATHAAPGVDYLTPYWTVRYYTEVAPPSLSPLPAWPLPAHR